MKRPLEGIKVLDLTAFLAGPYGTMILGDMGADVIKVEPLSGEQMRSNMRLTPDGESPTFMSINRNKRSLAIDLKADEGRELMIDLVKQSDVFVENFRVGVTKKLGLDYETLREIRPELVYCSVSGFGDTGPWSDRPGLDLITQGMSGLMSITGEPGGAPAKCGPAITDITSGMYGVIGILSALVAREQTGKGQFVSSSLFEAGLSLEVHESVQYFVSGTSAGPIGSGHRVAAPYQALKAKDGYLTVGAGADNMWLRMCKVIDREDLPADERFADNAGRMSHLPELIEELEKTLATDTVDNWVQKIVGAGVPCGPILNMKQVLEARHTLERKMVIDIDHPTMGKVKALGNPVKLSEMDEVAPLPAPLLGEHNEEILQEFGIAGDRIASLQESGVI